MLKKEAHMRINIVHCWDGSGGERLNLFADLLSLSRYRDERFCAW